MSIFLFFVILVILVVSHEFGHFIVAKWFGIRVDEFAFGFPPRIFSVKKGETEYSFNALPLGGYVKIFGENADDPMIALDEGKNRSLVHKPKKIQAAVISAGVIFNILLAWLLLSLGFMVGLPTAISGSNYASYAKDTALTVTSVLPDSPAQRAGLKTGDTITLLSSGAESVLPKEPLEVQNFIFRHPSDEISFSYLRGEESGTISALPKDGIISGNRAVGITTDLIGMVRLPFYLAFFEGGKNTYFLLEGTLYAFGHLIYDTVRGEGSMDALSGPVGIVSMVGEASTLGFVYLLSFTALISINLAVINLIPIPALDGGRLLFVTIEAIKGSPIRPKISQIINTTGFALLVFLMVMVTYQDIMRLVAG